MSFTVRVSLLVTIAALAGCNSKDNDKAAVVHPQCTLGQTEQNFVCVDVPLTATSISPTVLTQNQKTKITLVGTNLPSTAMFALQDGICEAAIEKTATSVSQWCTANSLGSKNVTAKYKIDIDTGKVDFTLTVNPKIYVKGLLNDTGIIGCANDTTVFTDCSAANLGGWFGLNQDGQLGRDVQAATGQLSKIGGGDAGFDFTKISATGQSLPANATEWSCVQDNHTGLMWEVKTDDGGLRDKDNVYTWYNTDATTNGGFEGYANNGNNTQAFVVAVNAQGLCGYKDWYLPDVEELRSIVNYGRTSVIDARYFPDAYRESYWSSSPDVYSNDNAWIFNTPAANEGRGPKGYALSVRLVRFGT
jgi:hypothetical protein